jgi:hypothetical protein
LEDFFLSFLSFFLVEEDEEDDAAVAVLVVCELELLLLPLLVVSPSFVSPLNSAASSSSLRLGLGESACQIMIG